MAEIKTSGGTRWDTARKWASKPNVSRGSTAILVAAFIASYGDIRNIINAGKAGRPMSIWDFVEVMFVMAFAAAHNLATYTDDTHARTKITEAPPGAVPPTLTESEWLKSQIPTQEK